MADRRPAPEPAGATPAASGAPAACRPTPPRPVARRRAAAGDDAVAAPPPVAEGVPVRWLDPAAPWAAQVGAVPGGTRLAPALAVRVSLLYDDADLDLREPQEWEAVVFPLGTAVDPAAAVAVDHDERDLRPDAPPGATYALTGAPLDRKAYVADAEKAIVDHLYRSRTHQVLRNRALKLAARAGEPAADFAARCRAAADEGADQAQVALQAKFETRIARARDGLDAARDRVAEAEAARSTRRTSDLAAGAGSLLGAVLGGRRSARTIARDMGRAMSGRSRGHQADQRVRSAENRAQDRQEALAELEADLAEALTAIDDEWAARAAEVETVEVPLEKSDIRVTARTLVWIPVG